MKRMGPSGGSTPTSNATVHERNYCLRLNDYEKKYAESFRSLRDDESFADVTLVAGCSSEDETSATFKAHRVILSACSSYFHSLLLKSVSPWHAHPVLLLTDVQSRDLQALLDFIYLGQVNVSQEALSTFLSVAQRLRIKGLCETSFQLPKKDPVYVTSNHGKRAKFMTNSSVLRSTTTQQIIQPHPHKTTETPIILASSGNQEEVPSSAVTEFISSNDGGDFIPSLPSHPFMISTDPPPPPPAAMVTIEDKVNEPKDLTFTTHTEVVAVPPTKKDRNSRKTCGYCHKDFHEMSLKRHIKDVHFKNENTYVICPHCCKQYASQNSLYSHLNRVHGVKKELIEGIQIQDVSGNVNTAGGTGGGGGGGSITTVPVSTATPGAATSSNEGSMDLAHHSDNSNG